MAQKKESDTLRQRKFAQQEFLKLKKMQNGELDAGPKPSEIAQELTFGEKIKNHWYHDKFAIIIIAVIIVVVATLLILQPKTKYDTTVVVFTHTLIGDSNCTKMGEYLEKYCGDLDGDGEINIRIINCSINALSNSEHSYLNRSKMQSLLAADPSALLFITDNDSYSYLMGLSEDIDVLEGDPIEFNEDFYDYCKDESGFYETPKDLQISCRTIKGTAIEKQKNVDTYYDRALSLLENLKNN